MSKTLRVLMVEDSEDDALLTIRELKKGGYEPEYERVETAEAMRVALRTKTWDVVLCDYRMPRFSGLAAIALLKETNIDIPLIIVSGAIGEKTAVECMRLGARDYVIKGNLVRLIPAIGREMEEAVVRRERKKVEKALQESEEELQWLFKSMLNAFVLFESVFDDDGHFISYRFVYVNDAYERITGVKNEEVKGKTVHEVWPETEPEWIKRYGEVAVTGTTQTFDLYHDPTNKIYHCNVYRPWDTKDRFCVIFEDITERKQTEETLRRSEENFRRSLDDSPLGVRIVTEEGKTIYANRALLDIYGFDSIEEFETTPVEKRYTPESYAGFLSRREKRQQGVDIPLEYRIAIIRKSGEVRHLQVFRKEILWDGERQFQVLYNDITESRRAEKQLRERELGYRRLAEDMPAFICTFLPDSTLTYVNPTYCEIFQKRFDELVGQKFLDFLPDKATREEVRRQYMSLTPENSVKTYEHKVIVSDGSSQHHWHRWTDRAFFNEKFEISHFQSIGEDITERKQAEEELRTSRSKLRALATRLQQIREEEGIRIAREVHDEMGGGLSGLKMDLSQLLHILGDADPGDVRAALMDRIHTCNASIDHMIQIVRRISTDLRPSILEDLGLVAALEWQLSEFTSRTAITHELATPFEYVELEEDTAVAVFRIVQEALTNVVRHARATKVAVVLREGERDLFGDEGLVLEIRDNGRGITKKEILHPASLGLLGMKERVLAFGGELSISGERGGGTTLILKIPRKQEETS